MLGVLRVVLAACWISVFASGQALYVDGVTGAFDVPHDPSFIASGDLTVEAWIYIDALPTVPAEIVNKKRREPWQGFTLHLQNGYVEFALLQPDAGPLYYQASAPWNGVAIGGWTHVAGVVSGTTISVVVNGAVAATATCPPDAFVGSDSNPLRFGRDSEAPAFNPGSNFTGLIDQVRVWSVGRTALEVASTMFADIDAAPGLVGAWRLNGDGTDHVGGLHGSLQGTASFVGCGEPLTPAAPPPFPPTTPAPAGPAAAVPWPEAVGGNGRSYEVVLAPCGVTWVQAHDAATAAGGHLAVPSSAAENAFVFSLIDFPDYWKASGPALVGPWIGGLQPAGSLEPAGGWRWVTGDAIAYAPWLGGPDNSCAHDEDRVHYSAFGVRTATWNDLNRNGCFLLRPIAYVVEYAPTLPCPPSTAFQLCASHDSAGHARLQLLNVPPGAIYGKTLISGTPAMPLGAGPVLGLHVDLFTLTVLFLPYQPGDPLSWWVTEPGLFPEAPFDFPPALTQTFAGQTWDLVAVAVTGDGLFHASNLARVAW
ncbi:MAG TPA: LamG-like jellyroll fold domain-containing protein [Planctomycetota bacterium]|nr:LamG-like jellyroll fold domain-containing protein [Planctomycetota bacterium]